MMEEARDAYRILVGKPLGKCPLVSSRDGKMELSQDYVQWQALT
jgi:hypothetical protein